MCPAFRRRHEGDACRENDNRSRNAGRVRSTTGRLNVKMLNWACGALRPLLLSQVPPPMQRSYGALLGRRPEMSAFSARDVAIALAYVATLDFRDSWPRGPSAISRTRARAIISSSSGNYDARFDSRAEHPRHAWISWTRGE